MIVINVVRRRELKVQMEERDGMMVVEAAMMVGSERQINTKLVRHAEALVQKSRPKSFSNYLEYPKPKSSH
jgi:uncharacterized protein (UPF0276 family)